MSRLASESTPVATHAVVVAHEYGPANSHPPGSDSTSHRAAVGRAQQLPARCNEE